MILKVILALVFLCVLCACAEEPRLMPGHQSIPAEAQKIELDTSEPVEKLTYEQRRQKYEQSLNGKISYFAVVSDQNGDPVPDALILVAIGRIGWGGSKEWRYFSHTDKQGKFSIYGGEGTRWSFSVMKRGYTPVGRSGDIRGPNSLISLPASAEKVTMWKNTGFDKKRLIIYSLKRIRVPWPPADAVKVDLLKAALVEEGNDWDIKIELRDPTAGEPKIMTEEWLATFLNHVFYTVNDGKISNLADPVDGQSPIMDFANFRALGGVLPGPAERVGYLLNSENHYFQFKSRGEKVFGVLRIDFGFGSEENPYIDLILNGAVNPTGSPALFEREPTVAEMSTTGYSESK